MTAAALATGNTVIMKPAEQSSVVGYRLMEILQNVGIPDGVVNYLPGIGEEVGPELIGSPDVHLVAFTGSRSVGLAINQAASQAEHQQNFVKRVIAEMGGTNIYHRRRCGRSTRAVLGIIRSSVRLRRPKKCSACSRVIVLESVYDTFVDKLVQATRDLKVGHAELPETTIGPVIDEEAFQRIQQSIRQAAELFPTLVSGDVGELAGEGFYIAPHIFGDVNPESKLAREEIFGPVLAVIKVKDLNEAFDVANDSLYALTGGIFSRSPANLRHAQRDAGRQPLSQPGHHGSHGRTATVRRLQALRHRQQSRGTRLPLAVRDPGERDGKHPPPRFRPTACEEVGAYTHGDCFLISQVSNTLFLNNFCTIICGFPGFSGFSAAKKGLPTTEKSNAAARPLTLAE